jgi:hypothetical protein
MDAMLVSDFQGSADRPGDQAAFLTHIHHLGFPTQYHRQNPGLAAHPPQRSGIHGDLTCGTVDDTGGDCSLQSVAQLVVVEGDDESGCLASRGGDLVQAAK